MANQRKSMSAASKSTSAASRQMSVIASRDTAKVSRYYHEAMVEAIKLVRESDMETQRNTNRK